MNSKIYIENYEEDIELKYAVEKFMSYVNKVSSNGELDIFSILFQSDFRVLTFISKHPDTHPSIISSELNISRPNVAAVLRVLENSGYITRATDLKNRRQIYVSITEKGSLYLDKVKSQLMMLFAAWFKILGKKETEHLFNILEISTSPNIITPDLKAFKFGK